MAVIAIVGASGLVGKALLEILADKLPNDKLLLFGHNSAGEKICCRGKSYTVKDIAKLQSCQMQYAIFVANREVSKQYIPPLAQNGVVCIDNSDAFRLHKSVPLVVPQINGRKIGKEKIISNPNCTTIQVVIALAALRQFGIQKITVATYQSVSGAGREGLEDLQNNHTYGKLQAFAHPIADNIIPQIGEMLPDGTTAEEAKMLFESRKILDLPHLQVNCTCVRVPVTVGHGACVNVQLREEFDLAKVKELLRQQKDLLLFENNPPMPSVLRHTHFVGVGRLVQVDRHNLNMFVVADNLLRGAAYNAYQILQIAMQENSK